jgi:hypothetical protein
VLANNGRVLRLIHINKGKGGEMKEELGEKARNRRISIGSLALCRFRGTIGLGWELNAEWDRRPGLGESSVNTRPDSMDALRNHHAI